MSTPFQPLPCDAGGGGDAAAAVDVEGTLVCDVDAGGNVVGTALVEAVYDEAGARTGTRLVNVTTGLPYVPVGTVQPCREGCCPEPVTLCDVQPDGSAIEFVRAYRGDEAGNLDTVDTLLDGSPYAPTGTVGTCDPYRLCTPSSTQDLGADCGPGEPINTAIVLDDGAAPNSVVTDDPSADALCGGTWGPGPDPQPAPFPVDEPFRNATFNDPTSITQGSAPYACLTASPGCENVDTVGNGWLEMSDINSGTNGFYQIGTAFPGNLGVTAGATFASHDGTAQGGDGMAFILTDGAGAVQATPVGGGGSLGLFNIQNGYVAVVLDEYGGSHYDSGLGVGGNSISIQKAGSSRVSLDPANIIATLPLSPHFINQTTRATPGRLSVSTITEAGQTYVSVSVDWNDGAGPVQYFNRVNVTPAVGPVPATLRMGLSAGSGGAFRSEHEWRDLQALAAGVQDWRAFPVTTDPIPACVTQVDVTAEVDVTFVSDTQAAGNADNEAWFWLVNVATNTIIDRAELSSLPSQVGAPHHLTLNSGLIPVADLPNIRVYVGAETRDQAGDYGHLWENLDISVTGAGCPVTPRRTLEISAVCPIPVTIVGGDADGGAAAPAVFNAPATFEDAVICATVAGVAQPAFRREVRTPDGNITFSFLGADGIPITPDSWAAGACAEGFAENVILCDFGPADNVNGVLTKVKFMRTFYRDAAGVLLSTADTDLLTGAPYVPIVGGQGIGTCGDIDAELEFFCDLGNLDGPNGEPHIFYRNYQFDAETSGFFGQNARDLETSQIYGVVGPVVPYPCGGASIEAAARRDVEQAILCDDNGPFLRAWQYGDDTGTPSGTPDDYTLDGAPYAPVGTVAICAGTFGNTVIQEMCDRINISTTVQFYRQTTFDETGTPIALGLFDAVGSPYAPVGEVRLGHCDPNRVEHEILCDQPSGVRFLRRWLYTGFDADSAGFNDYTFDGITPYVVVGTAQVCGEDPGRDVEQVILCDNNGAFIRAYQYGDDTGAPSGAPSDYTLAGAPYVPVGPVVNCGAAGTARDEELLILCDATPTRFLRRYNYDASTGALIGIVNTTLDGSTAFVPVGAVGICTTAIASDFDFLSTVLCDANGTQFIQRLTFNSATGAVTATTNTTLTGAAFAPVAPVALCTSCCPVVLGEGCTNVGSLRYTALRLANGSISLIDSVTGATVLPANIIVCANDDVARTLTAQARLIGDVDAPWTPGADVVGTLTAVSMTVLTGTATLIDQSGTVLAGLPAGYSASWSASDDNTLSGPTSIDAIGGNTVVHWTQR